MWNVGTIEIHPTSNAGGQYADSEHRRVTEHEKSIIVTDGTLSRDSL